MLKSFHTLRQYSRFIWRLYSFQPYMVLEKGLEPVWLASMVSLHSIFQKSDCKAHDYYRKLIAVNTLFLRKIGLSVIKFPINLFGRLKNVVTMYLGMTDFFLQCIKEEGLLYTVYSLRLIIDKHRVIHSGLLSRIRKYK